MEDEMFPDREQEQSGRNIEHLGYSVFAVQLSRLGWLGGFFKVFRSEGISTVHVFAAS